MDRCFICGALPGARCTCGKHAVCWRHFPHHCKEAKATEVKPMTHDEFIDFMRRAG